MKNVETIAAQGDLLFIKVDKLPSKLTEEKMSNTYVVGHSESGHNHVAEGKDIQVYLQDSMISYLDIASPTDIVHKRPYDTHETLRLTPGLWEVRRQREWAPEGWRRVED